MKFSVIMPTLDRPREIFDALEAVRRQTHPDWELIIVGTLYPGLLLYLSEIADRRITYLVREGQGISDQLNAGMDLAQGDVFVWASDDDQLVHDALEYVDTHLNVAMWGYGKVLINHERVYGLPWSREKMLQGNIVPQPAAFWRRGAYEEIGGFDLSVDMASDYDYWLRLAERWEPRFFDEVLAFYSLHPGSVSLVRKTTQQEHAEIVRRRYV